MYTPIPTPTYAMTPDQCKGNHAWSLGLAAYVCANCGSVMRMHLGPIEPPIKSNMQKVNIAPRDKES
jgi:hypothetical protein